MVDDRPRRRLTVRRLMLWVVAAALVLAPLTWLGRAVGLAREAARRSQCMGHLKQLSLALYNYESAFGALPPPFVADAQGKPLYSWRVLVLPFLEQHQLYTRFRLDEPWDGPNNSKLLDSMPMVFSCPSHHAERPPRPGTPGARCTSYVALSGPETMFPATGAVRFSDVKDGLDQTIMLVETDQADIPWTAPVDLDPSTGKLTGMSSPCTGPTSRHVSGVNACMGDADIRYLNFRSSRELQAAASIAGAEPLDIEKLEVHRRASRESKP